MAENWLASVEPQLIISVDIETDGPSVLDNAMLSIGAAAYVWPAGRSRRPVSTWTAVLEPRHGTAPNSLTEAWWDSQDSSVSEAARRGGRPAAEVMLEFAAWLERLEGDLSMKPVFCALPAGFDFGFVYAYLMHFVGHSPFGLGALDLKTLGSAILGVGFREDVYGAIKRSFPTPLPHTHIALDDALEQGDLTLRMLDAATQSLGTAPGWLHHEPEAVRTGVVDSMSHSPSPYQHRRARPLVLVDMDGVIADWEEGLLRWSAGNPMLERYLDPEPEQRAWSLLDSMPADVRMQAQDLIRKPGFYRSLRPIPGSTEALEEMVDIGLDVFICTTPSSTALSSLSEKMEWIQEVLGPDWVHRVVLTYDKTIVRGDVLIDDKPDITGARRPEWTHVVFDCPANRSLLMEAPRLNWTNWSKVLSKVLPEPVALSGERESDRHRPKE